MNQTIASSNQPVPAPSANDRRREQMAGLRGEMKGAMQGLKAELAGLNGFLSQDGGRGYQDILMAPIRFTFGLGLVVGFFWGLWQSLVWLLS